MAQSHFVQLIRDSVDPCMKQLGFTKSGDTFTKQEEGFTKIFVVQTSQFNTVTEFSFTIEVGIHFPDLYQKAFGREVKNPKINDCVWQFRRRIGYLKGLTDAWYELKADTDMVSLSKQVAWDIDWYVRRYFAQYTSLYDCYTK